MNSPQIKSTPTALEILGIATRGGAIPDNPDVYILRGDRRCNSLSLSLSKSESLDSVMHLKRGTHVGPGSDIHQQGLAQV